MKNTFKFMLVAVAMTVALAACGGGKTTEAAADTTATEASAPADTTTAPADTTAAN